jgi:ribosomal protein S18 acetylase RimI-like enzyme
VIRVPPLQTAAQPISIRRAVPDDAQGILECLRLAFEPYRNSYTPAAFEDTVLSPETIQHRMAEMSVFVAATGTGDIAGTVGGKPAGGGEGHIRGMAVRPDLAGTGLAQSLLDTVENELRRLGCARLTLDTTRPLERAVRFYVRNGFRFSGVVRDFFGMPLFEYVKELQVQTARMTAEIDHHSG